MKTHKLFQSLLPSGLALGLALTTNSVLAHPYATSLTNASGVISFRLNESADTVKVLWNGGSSSFTIGALARGLTVTNLSGAGVTSPFQVEVTKAGAGVPTLISDNANANNQFFGPRAVAVNKRPASPYFGRIYVGNTPGVTGTGRRTGDGIYMLNADSSDAIGQGTNVLTAGINMDLASASMPWRIRVGDDDDKLYMCNWTDTGGNLFVADANITAGTGTNIFEAFAGPYSGALPANYNHGSVSEVLVTGSLGSGNLTVYTVDEDYETNPGFLTEPNSLWRYEIGAGPLPWSAMPNGKVATPAITTASQVMGLDRGANGFFYLIDSRSSGADNCLQVIDPAGPTVVYESRPESLSLGFPRDILSNSCSVAVSMDQKYLAVQRNGGQVVIVPMVNGIPNLAGRTEITAIGTARQIVFDAANNFYVISAATERLRVYSLGLTTTAKTGSDGTFSITSPGSSVSVAVSANTTYEDSTVGTNTAWITLTRANDANDFSLPLTVSFTTNGSTAVRGSDFVFQTNGVTLTADTITIPAGTNAVTFAMAVINDTTTELSESVVFNVAGGVNYSAGIPATATMAIVDNELPQLRITSISTNIYERLANDYARVTIERLGDTNAPTFALEQSSLVLSGSAVVNTHYTVANLPINFDPGVMSATVRLFYPIDNSVTNAPRTITVGLTAGTGFTAATNTATTIILDDDLPPATPVFAETFSTADSATNWVVRFADTNSPAVEDYNLQFGYDYSALSVPAAPNGTDTTGVYMQVNKADGTPTAAALNLYPKNQSFSGDYILRFDMYLIVGNGVSTTEYALFGINHSGTKTNWFRNSSGGIAGGSFDGLFYGIESDAAALGDYVLYSSPTTAGNNPTPQVTGRNASTLTQIFKSPPFFGSGGAPSNPELNSEASWVDVEVSQIGSVVTLKMNQVVIFTYTNATSYTSGNIMLGYTDAYDSVGPAASGVIYDNVRVISLTAPTVVITQIKIVGGNVEIDFTGPTSDAASAYVLQEASAVTGTYGDVSATITGSGGVYKAVRAVSPTAKYFRIKR
ncbi:MAG: hypothetical protein QM813_14595 [Verrucomicrobiota bacterium]